MRTVRRYVWPALLTCLLGAGAVTTPAQEGTTGAGVDLKVVKYDELAQLVKGFKGKVVVVDFWADYCVPCKREFPHLVELSKRYAAQGFQAVSVTVDEDPTSDPNDPKRKQILKFLTKHSATFPNLWLEADPAEWQKKLGTEAVPCVFVFNRAGKWVRKFQDDADYQKIGEMVAELLREK